LARKKTRKQEEDKQPEDLLVWASNLSTVIIFGKPYSRIRYGGEKGNACPGCHASKGKYHQCSCPQECCPYCRGIAIDCPCESDVELAEEKDFIECKDGTL